MERQCELSAARWKSQLGKTREAVAATHKATIRRLVSPSSYAHTRFVRHVFSHLLRFPSKNPSRTRVSTREICRRSVDMFATT